MIRAFLRTTLLLSLAASCGAVRSPQLLRDPPCLDGPPPHVGIREADESIALLQREWVRANHASSFVRARMIEALPSLSPDLSDLFPAPRCERDLYRRNEPAFAERPLPFSRVLVAQLRTTHGSNRLVDLVDLPEQSITPYALDPREPGPPPSRRLVHHLALLHAPDPTNDPESNRRLGEYVRRTNDVLDLLILHPVARSLLRSGQPDARAVANAWLEDLPRRLAGPADRIGLELVLLRINDLGQLASRLGIGPEMRALLDPILAKKGELPLTQDVPQGAHDLAEIAREALYAVEVPPDSLHEYALPPPRRHRFNARDLDTGEPANGRPTGEETRDRLRDLDAELDVLHMNPARCYVIRELVRWSPPEEGPRRFDALIAPIFDGERIRFSTETLCRMAASVDLAGVDDRRRATLVLDLLAAPPERVSPRDTSADGRGAIVVEGDEVRSAAANALSAHLDLIEREPALRSWLEAQAALPVRMEHGAAHSTSLLQPAFERVLSLNLASAEMRDRDRARAILRAWMESVRAIEVGSITNIYPHEILRARVRALGDFGKRADLVSEIEAFLRDRKDKRGAAVASYLLTL